MLPNSKLLEIIQIHSEIAKLGLDLGNVMGLVVERTLALVGADGAAIELAEGGDMVYRAASGIAESFLGLRLAGESSLSGMCVDTGEILRCEDSETDDRVNRNATRQIGLRSMIVMPLFHRDSVVGVLKAMSKKPNKFTREDELLLGFLSEVVASAMFYATRLEKNDLFYEATHDSLTKLANRSLFMDKMRNMTQRKIGTGERIGLLIIDMDGLKKINDTHGHRTGDAALQALASRITISIRESDLAARLGGDEFAVIVNPVQNPDEIKDTAGRIESSVHRPFSFEGKSHGLMASIGDACFPDDGKEMDRLFEAADQRMYHAKRQRAV